MGSIAAPAVPGCGDTAKPGSRAQHSSVEALFLAPMVVTFRVGGIDDADVDDCAGAGAVAVTAAARAPVERKRRFFRKSIVLAANF